MARVLLVDYGVVPAPDRRAVELLNLVKALAPRYELDVLTLKSPDLAYVDRTLRARMLRVPVTGDDLPEQVESFRRAVRRQLEGNDYDVVHFRSAWAGLPICADRVEGEAGPRLVFEPTLSPLTEPRAADAALAATLAKDEEVCLAAADRIVVPTAAAADFLTLRGLGPRLVRVPPGVDVDHFDWEPAPESSRPRILYAGYLSAGRGLRLLLGALGILRRQRNAELVLVGPVDPGFGPALDEAVHDASLESLVTQQGSVDHDEMPRVLSSATICVAPSAAEEAERPLAPFPIKILEYMACRRPVVAARRPIVEEVVRQGVDGLLFDPGSEEALAEALTTLIDDAALRERLAASAYERARSTFPASAVRRRMLELYATLAPPRSAAGRPGGAAVAGLPTDPDATTARHESGRGEPAEESPGESEAD